MSGYIWIHAVHVIPYDKLEVKYFNKPLPELSIALIDLRNFVSPLLSKSSTYKTTNNKIAGGLSKACTCTYIKQSISGIIYTPSCNYNTIIVTSSWITEWSFTGQSQGKHCNTQGHKIKYIHIEHIYCTWIPKPITPAITNTQLP